MSDCPIVFRKSKQARTCRWQRIINALDATDALPPPKPNRVRRAARMCGTTERQVSDVIHYCWALQLNEGIPF